MDRIQQLKDKIREATESMRSLNERATSEGRDLTDEEVAEFCKLDDKVKRMKEDLKREERLQELEAETKVPDKKPHIPDGRVTSDEPEWRNLGEFFATIATDPRDSRLQKYYRVQTMGTGSAGGFMVPDQFMAGLKSVTPQEAIVRPRATVIAAGESPDAKLTLNALDQGAASNVYGGVIIYHLGETAPIPESSVALRQVELSPHKLAGYMTASNDLLNNWGAASGFLESQMRLAMIGAEDNDFLSGNGVNRAKGIINADCRINVARAAANNITTADVIGMYARVRFGGGLVWITSQTTIPELATLVDTNNNYIWAASAVPGIPPTLYGIPVLFNDRSPALGSTGDLILANLSYYLIKDGSGPFVAVSNDFLFSTDQTAFRIVWHVDGKSWLNEAIPLEGSTANTVSPFVVLN